MRKHRISQSEYQPYPVTLHLNAIQRAILEKVSAAHNMNPSAWIHTAIFWDTENDVARQHMVSLAESTRSNVAKRGLFLFR